MFCCSPLRRCQQGPTQVGSDKVAAGGAGDEVAHEGPLDTEGCQHVREQGKGDELSGGQAAGQEAPPVEVWEVEERGKEGICVG